MKIDYRGSSKILKRLAELVNRSQNVALRQDNTDKNTLYWTDLDGVEITINIPSGSVEVDAELSETSTNPAENQAITKELAKKANKSDIPTVGDGVLSVQRNSKSVGTFSANAAEDASINISVPDKVSELENDAGYGTYTKPATGIPKSDLASGVQASLDKADTALQKHQDISGKLDKTGDASNTTVTFTAASARENVKTGEKLSVIVGKIAKWFADLKTVAFTGNYNDLANKPTIPDISGKQDKLTAGANITLSGNTISAKDTTYSNATTSKAGLMSATDKTNLNANTLARHTHSNKATLDKLTDAQLTKLDGVDPDLYLHKAGGVMTGDIDLASNGVDLLVGSQRATQTTYATAVAGATISTKQTFSSGLPERKSLVGSFLDQNSVWHSIISVRHRNGYNDGVNYGMYLRSLLTSDGSLIWNKQTGASKWQGERVLLDSTNYSSYAAKSDHTHAMITNSALWVSGADNTAKWARLGTLVSSGNFSNAVIRVWSGDGANGRANQNSSFEIQVKDGWQSTLSANKACGVTVYRISCSNVKVKVIPTAHDTYTVWAYLPWGYWNGNYAVYGKYKSWTSQHLIQSEEPEGTGADTAYYDQAFLTSTVAKATEATALAETAWTAVPTAGAAETVGRSIKYLKSGNTVFVQGSISFSASLNTPVCGKMPSDCLPNQKLVFTGWDIIGAPASFAIILDTDGKLSFLSPGTTAYWFKDHRAYSFNFSYHIN